MVKLIVFVFAFALRAAAQNIVPFASKGNIVELAVQNTSTLTQENVTVEASNVPSWINLSSSRQTFARLDGAQEKTAPFAFSVDKSAPVGKEETLRFTVSTLSGQSWTREIRISIAAPEKFELLQNYPNPFNPTTVIGYQLPAFPAFAGRGTTAGTAESRVTLRVYDLLGREVATLVDAPQTAGYHEETWDASRYSSGIYVYELAAASETGKTVLRKTMLLVK